MAEFVDVSKKPTGQVRGSTFDAHIVESDLAKFREELTCYKHSSADTEFLINALSKVAPIAKLPPMLRKLACEAFKRVTVGEGQVVCTAGDPADSFYVVGAGSFNLDSPEVNEGRSSLGQYSKGGVMSERVLYMQSVGRTPFTIRCEQEGVLFVMPKSAFFTVLKHVDDGVGVVGDAFEFLAGLPVCADIPRVEIRSFASSAKLKVKQAGNAIFSEGDDTNGVMILQTGSITVKLPRPSDSDDDFEKITFVSGDVIGEKQLAALCGGKLIAATTCSYMRMALVPTSSSFDRIRWNMDNLVTYKIFKFMDVFGILSPDQIETLVKASRVATFEAGAVVSTRGDTGPSPLWIIINGLVTVKRPNPKDTTQVDVLGRLGPGEHFGAKNIVDSSAPREVDVTADTALLCLTLDTASFGDLLPLVQHSLARELATRRWVLENRNKVKMDELECVRTIGVGTFGRVRLMVHAPTRKPYALKTLKKRQLVEMSQVGNVRSEQQLLSTCSHPFLLKLAAAFQDGNCLYMVLEFIQGGELYKYMQDSEDGTLPLETSRFYAASIVAAFAYLNSLDIIYRDLKPENILLSREGLLKVIDMGFAKILTQGRTFTFCGTPDYMAPEIICHRGYALSCDWWSLGVFIFEMINGLPPFEAFEDPSGIDTFGKVLEYATGKTQIDFPEDIDADAKHLILNLCEPDEINKRYGAEQTKAHPFFKSIDFMKLEKGQITPPYIPPVKGDIDASNFEVIEEPPPEAAPDPNLRIPPTWAFGRFGLIPDQPSEPARKYNPAAASDATSESQVDVNIKVDAANGSGGSGAGASRAKEPNQGGGGGGCCILQ